VEKVFASRLAAIQEEHGLSTSQIAHFFLADPWAIQQAATISKLQFYVPFFGSVNNFLLAMKKCPYLLRYNLDMMVKPNVSLLSEYALSALDISKICLKKPSLLCLPSWKVQAMAAWVDSFGIPRGKPMFRLALQCVACCSEKSIAAEMELLKKALQRSDAEVMTLLSRSPALITTSLDRIQRVSQFLVSEAELDPKYIASSPGLMTYILEGHLRPRFYVVKFLKEKGLLGQQRSYYSSIVVKEKDFVERFIHPYKDAAPHLAEDYATACRRQVASRFKSQEPRTGLESVGLFRV
jgi:mTERF domain-containing protein, mitochondrial